MISKRPVDKKITMTGTLQDNKCEIPPQFVNTETEKSVPVFLDFKRS
jgi:hypothetical protein